MGTCVLSQRYIGWSMKLGVNLRLVPRLRMCGAVRLLPLYAFIAWTVTSLLLPLTEDEDAYPVLRIKNKM